MRSTHLRLVAAVSGLAVFGLLGSAQGATVASTGPKTLTITDDIGDEAGGQAAMDIAKVIFTTTGKSVTKKVKGKSVVSYTPDTLVVSEVLSAPPSSLPTALYELHAATTACGDFWLYYDGQHVASGGQVACGSPADSTGDTTTSFGIKPTVSGNSITWTIPFTLLPKPEMRLGSSLTDIHAYVALGEPVEGTSTEVLLPSANPDNADSAAVYKIG